MGEKGRFQIRWITNFALICVFSTLVLILLLQKILDRTLGEDYSQAFLYMKHLDSSLFMAVSLPVMIYIFLVSLMVVVAKIFFSHCIAGPIFRLEKCAESLKRGDLTFSTKLRPGDQLKDQATLMGELRDTLAAPLKSVSKNLNNIDDTWAEIDGLPEKEYETNLPALLRRIEAELSAIRQQLSPPPAG